ncbi:MAG: LapA family protein [Methylovirgula sp.]
MKRLLQWLGLLILVILAMIGVAFSVANRQIVSIHLDPFTAKPTEQISVELPLFLALIVSLALGVLIGGFFTWFGQGKHRRALRAARGELARRPISNG